MSSNLKNYLNVPPQLGICWVQMVKRACNAGGGVIWGKEQEWCGNLIKVVKSNDDLSNQEMNQYWTVYWWEIGALCTHKTDQRNWSDLWERGSKTGSDARISGNEN